MAKQYQALKLAILFYTRIPVKSTDNISEELQRQSSVYFPLIGWIVGGVSAGCFVLASYGFPMALTVLLSLLSSILLTGALHEDGLADICDGFGAGWDKEQILRIMKDSQIGVYGVIGLIIVIFIKFFSLSSFELSLVPLILWVAHSLSRFLAISCLYQYQYVGGANSKSKNMVKVMTLAELLQAGLWGCLPLVFVTPKFLILLAPVIIIRLILGHIIYKKIGGYTGDCLGGLQQITEVGIYLTFVSAYATGFLI